MKKIGLALALIAVMLMGFGTVYAQSNLYAYQYKVDAGDWIPTAAPIPILISPTQIIVEAQFRQVYTAVKQLSYDGSICTWRCLDDAGIVCNVSMGTNRQDRWLYLVVEYHDIIWVYRCSFENSTGENHEDPK